MLSENYLLENSEWKNDIIPEIMDGKNIADFIDPDIEEKLEALEREEERLEAEGFYASDEDIVRFNIFRAFVELTGFSFFKFDSDDEREAVEAEAALSAKVISQLSKKAKKNHARLPRTAGLRTLSELTTELTKAGYDPSRIQERAAILAKIQGAKRKRTDDEDVEMGDSANEGEDSWMDVDEDEAGPTRAAKQSKTNSGAVVAKGRREPKTNRQLAGLRDQGVRHFIVFLPQVLMLSTHSKQARQTSSATWANDHETCWQRPEKATDRSQPKWSVFCSSS